MLDSDTIAAPATAPGHGGIGVVRLSGPRARAIAEAMTGVNLRPRHAHYCGFRDAAGTIVDSGIALFFPAPNSFTGEDVAELQGHGGPVVLDMLLREACALGARPARPGEFSERAFLNGKIDLAQAEAIADLINSSTEQAARHAGRSLQGEFSRRIDDLARAVTELRVYVEAAIDFPEEEVDFLASGEVEARLREILSRFDAITAAARRGNLLREGIKLVIAGRPNAGKSSLLNALSGQDSAIVTPIEGTTRDVLREHIQIDGLPLHIVDTAGLRDSGDAIEMEGVRRARLEIESADHILLVVDGSAEWSTGTSALDMPDSSLPPGTPVTRVVNKCDLSGEIPRLETIAGIDHLHLSAKTGAGIALLREHLKRSAGFDAGQEGGFSARRRHLRALEAARQSLVQGLGQLAVQGAGELLAEDLRVCQSSLGEITGRMSSDELLGEIFSSFCIGK